MPSLEKWGGGLKSFMASQLSPHAYHSVYVVFGNSISSQGVGTFVCFHDLCIHLAENLGVRSSVYRPQMGTMLVE